MRDAVIRFCCPVIIAQSIMCGCFIRVNNCESIITRKNVYLHIEKWIDAKNKSCRKILIRSMYNIKFLLYYIT